MHIVTFIRHAETDYNIENRFAGRVDCKLTYRGICETKKRYKYKNSEKLEVNNLESIVLTKENYLYYLSSKK